MSQNPLFEFSPEELEAEIDSLRYASFPRSRWDRQRAGGTRRPRRASVAVLASEHSPHHQQASVTTSPTICRYRPIPLHTTGSAQALNGFGQPMVSFFTRRSNAGMAITIALLLWIVVH